ncbi:hypothetical protein ACFPT7_07755 [Acidicapsa dinghuensis]|uniref:Uncharacterized protein n=1 Tax=Acidicapsa dinghuensis TaxID=2218256 RepID=A0ABW1EGR0_9BACT|nr:hypothetical protein [Acidicapsa dinghuensis]
MKYMKPSAQQLISATALIRGLGNKGLASPEGDVSCSNPLSSGGSYDVDE